MLTFEHGLIAQALNDTKPMHSHAGVWEYTCQNVADALGRNARAMLLDFDRPQFLKACGV